MQWTADINGKAVTVFINEDRLHTETQEERNARRLREREASIERYEGKTSPSAMLACCDAMTRQLDKEIAEDEYLASIGKSNQGL